MNLMPQEGLTSMAGVEGGTSKDQVVKTTVRRIEQMIQSGRLPPGAMMPSQRILAEQLKIGRSSLREALSILEALGAIQTRPRRGTVVREVRADDPRPAWRLADSYSPEEVYQFRIVIESYAVRQAAVNASQVQIDDLHAMCDAMRQAARSGDLLDYTEQDFAFHRHIMHLSDNRLFVELHGRYGEVFRESQRMPLAWHRSLWDPIAEHENIVRAIEKRDPDNAPYFMRVHLLRGADRLGLKLTDSL